VIWLQASCHVSKQLLVDPSVYASINKVGPAHPEVLCPAVLANAAFGRPPVQQQISDGGGVELLLDQCQVQLNQCSDVMQQAHEVLLRTLFACI
jgi:hypothetical protein